MAQSKSGHTVVLEIHVGHCLEIILKPCLAVFTSLYKTSYILDQTPDVQISLTYLKIYRTSLSLVTIYFPVSEFEFVSPRFVSINVRRNSDSD